VSDPPELDHFSPDFGDTPLTSNFWSDEDFEEIEEEIDEEEAVFS